MTKTFARDRAADFAQRTVSGRQIKIIRILTLLTFNSLAIRELSSERLAGAARYGPWPLPRRNRLQS